jgi:nicotinate-nucleotide adenylyltransferase
VNIPKDPQARIGIFGGTFNPFHVGHMQALQTVKTRGSLSWISIVPTNQNPLKPETEGPTSEQRMEIIKIAIQGQEGFGIDQQELERGGQSFTIDTVSKYAETVSSDRLFLIVGSDQFENFDKWKSFEKILTLANLIVVSRPPASQPNELSDFPEGLRPLVSEIGGQVVALKSGRFIEFVRLRDNDVSASDIRKRIRSGRAVERFLTMEVESYIRQNNIYASLGPKIGDLEKFTEFCGQVLFDKKGITVRGFDLRETDSASEFTLIASGTSTRHTAALAENVMKEVKGEYNVFPQSIEGMAEGRWVLLDYGSLIVHVFYDFVRQEYRLENLWSKGKDLGLVDPNPGPVGHAASGAAGARSTGMSANISTAPSGLRPMAGGADSGSVGGDRSTASRSGSAAQSTSAGATGMKTPNVPNMTNPFDKK